MKDYIFTFGVDKPYRYNYVRITAESIEQARHMMFKAHGAQWAFQYPLEEAEQMIMDQRLDELAHFSIEDDIDWEWS